MGLPKFASCRHTLPTGCRSFQSKVHGSIDSSPGLLVHAEKAGLLGNTESRGRIVSRLSNGNWVPTQQLSRPRDTIDRTVKTLTSAFNIDPVYRWILNDFPASQHPDILAKFFRAFLTQAWLNNGLFLEAGNFEEACGLAMPPGSRLENPWTLIQAGLVSALWDLGLGTLKRAVYDYTGGVRSILEKALTREEQRNHWYGVFMGASLEHQGKGLGSSMFRHMKGRARGDGMPFLFEAAKAPNRDLYLRHGAEILGEFIVGKGEVGPDGLPKQHGEGIVIWSMIWRP